jgi:hypothetical protein
VKVDIKAFCPTCHRFVSDDLSESKEGLKSEHEHTIRLLRVLGEIEPGMTISAITELTPKTYLEDASRLDSELIVSYLKRSLRDQGIILPLPDPLLQGLVEGVLKAARQVAVDDEKKHRKASEKKKLAGKKSCALPDDEPIV